MVGLWYEMKFVTIDQRPLSQERILWVWGTDIRFVRDWHLWKFGQKQNSFTYWTINLTQTLKHTKLHLLSRFGCRWPRTASFNFSFRLLWTESKYSEIWSHHSVLLWLHAKCTVWLPTYTVRNTSQIPHIWFDWPVLAIIYIYARSQWWSNCRIFVQLGNACYWTIK